MIGSGIGATAARPLRERSQGLPTEPMLAGGAWDRCVAPRDSPWIKVAPWRGGAAFSFE